MTPQKLSQVFFIAMSLKYEGPKDKYIRIRGILEFNEAVSPISSGECRGLCIILDYIRKVGAINE